jgi:hypothetical protein
VSDIVERLDADLAIGCSASMGDTKEARDEIVRLRQINEDHCRAVNTLSVEAVELTRQRDEAHEIIGKAVVNVPPELRSADPSDGIKALRAERDRLRSELVRLYDERNTAIADRDRLRDALEKIAENTATGWPAQVARAALKGDTP